MTPEPDTGTSPRSASPGPATADHAAVVNDEGQYALWPLWRPLPHGWHDTGVHGGREECLDHIERVWTDLRPRSVRDAAAPSTDR